MTRYSRLYAIEIQKSNLLLITMLNGGVEPKIEKKRTFYVFEVSEDGSDITFHDIVDYRDWLKTYDIVGPQPFMVRIKPTVDK